MAKQDNQSDTVAHLREHISNTEQNLHEAEDYLNAHANAVSADKKHVLEEKNDRRRASIRSFSKEISDELQ